MICKSYFVFPVRGKKKKPQGFSNVQKSRHFYYGFFESAKVPDIRRVFQFRPNRQATLTTFTDDIYKVWSLTHFPFESCTWRTIRSIRPNNNQRAKYKTYEWEIICKLVESDCRLKFFWKLLKYNWNFLQKEIRWKTNGYKSYEYCTTP